MGLSLLDYWIILLTNCSFSYNEQKNGQTICTICTDLLIKTVYPKYIRNPTSFSTIKIQTSPDVKSPCSNNLPPYKGLISSQASRTKMGVWKPHILHVFLDQVFILQQHQHKSKFHFKIEFMKCFPLYCYETFMFGWVTHTLDVAARRVRSLFTSFTFCNITISYSLIPKELLAHNNKVKLQLRIRIRICIITF